MLGFCSCASRGIFQEPQPEEKVAEVDVSRLDILVSRHEQSSAFCLPNNWLSNGCLPLPWSRGSHSGQPAIQAPVKSCDHKNTLDNILFFNNVLNMVNESHNKTLGSVIGRYEGFLKSKELKGMKLHFLEVASSGNQNS
ncbi:src kinase-associated phosphoprotein 2 [Platysternon megacephalum]|uniref:Src kinase-associated phosphoprotein 2 n=1 Tax=Platysternon megacephalum TaxID=55544 RepID=A0A4D9EQ65_9SAUR|nr:src kinase-associated phosphoprotein 2 [Platysternon megacephalum]